MSINQTEPMLNIVSEKTFAQEVLASSQPVLVHFWAPWCGLCRMINPMLIQIQSKQNRPIKLVTINADENFKLANVYRLKNLPTLLVFENGILTERMDDFQGRDSVFNSLEKIMQYPQKNPVLQKQISNRQ